MKKKNNKGQLVFRQKLTLDSGRLCDAVIWSVPKSEKYPDGIKYRLAFVDPFTKAILLLFDNHYPKGHHMHLCNGDEVIYKFRSVSQLVEDFFRAVENDEEASR